MTATVLADGDLLVRARDGDRAAFESAVGPLLPDAYRLALVMLRDHADAEDCVQDSTFKAWRHIGRLRAGVSVRPWFLAIVANQSRDMLRRRWRSVLRLPLMSHGAGEAFEPDVAGIEDVRRALRLLAPDERAVLLLRYGLDMEIAEVAASLDLKVAAAKSRIHRALARLRPVLEIEAEET